ncbi:MAG: hypothetical protein MUO80_04395, partial [Dehalococcoidia bacterium]|nr:hypothetical protein [Dehalococcoidia bacterium]
MDEDILFIIGVARHQVGGVGHEGHVAAVSADGGRNILKAAAIAFAAVGSDAHPLRDPGLPVVDEDVCVTVGVAGHQVRGVGREGDVAAVSADGGVIALVIPLAAVGGDAHPLRDPGLPVVDEDVCVTVGVAEYQVGGAGLEGDIAAVGTDGGELACAIPRAAWGVAHPLRDPGLPVVDENVFSIVVVVGHQVRGVGREGDVAAVSADGGVSASAIPLDPVGGDAYPLRDPGQPVVDEDIPCIVGVVGHQVGGGGFEGDVAAVSADGG